MLSLLDLPREIRDRIYRFLLVKNTGTSQALDITDTLCLYYMPHPNCPWKPSQGAIHPTKWCFSSPKIANIGSTAILQTCKRVAEEGAQVLYGSSRISCLPGHAFHTTFLPTIGSFNSSCVRSVHLWLDTFFTSDMIHLTTPQFEQRLNDSTRFLVNLLSKNLSQVQDLILAIPVAGCYHLNLNSGLPSSKIWWIRAHCAMLWFSAWATVRHPRLKRAVWSQRWMSRYTPDSVEDLQYLDITVRITSMRTKWVNRQREDFKELAWYVRQEMLDKGLRMQSIQGIALDSRVIRRQSLGCLVACHNPLSYRVDETANISEMGQAQHVLEDIYLTDSAPK